MKGRILVIGGGTNGLVAATVLAKAGCKVSLVERREQLGGLAAGEEFHPGFRSPGLLHRSANLRSEVVSALDLERHGLALAPARPWCALERGGEGLTLWRDPVRAHAAIAERSPRDAEAYATWRADLARLRTFVSHLLTSPPPDLAPSGMRGSLELLKTGIDLRRLGEADMLELMRVAPMAAADWTQDTFETPLLCATLMVPALAGTWLGPWSAGSAACLLAHEVTTGRAVVGGPAALARALASAAHQAGVRVLTGSEVQGIQLDGGRVARAVLADGTTLDADAVLSTVDPAHTLLDLLPLHALSQDLEERMLHWRARGTTAKVHLALDGPLVLGSHDGVPIDSATTGESVDDLERAFDAVKYGQMSARPALDLFVPSVDDPSCAPEGKHVVSILAHYAPFDLNGGWDATAKKDLEMHVLDALEEVCPGTRARILGCETLSPADIAERYGMRGGHVHHGEHALDQLLVLRPSVECAHYATPVPGLFLGGSGSHPGGGITGAPGLLAARALLRH